MSLFVSIANAAVGDVSGVDSVMNKVLTNIVKPIIGFVFALAVLLFVYGVFEMIRDAGDADAREKGRAHIFYSLIGIFIMIGVWGILQLISGTIKGL